MRASILTAIAILTFASTGVAQESGVDPRDPDAIKLPELGRMVGTLRRPLRPETGEQYGRMIWALGDINHDKINDWAVLRERCDTMIDGSYPQEVLLYRGRRGSLPATSTGERIGPREIGAWTAILGSGDFDRDGNVDIALSVHELLDTSAGNTNLSYEVRNVFVMWGNLTGSYSIDDTTRLLCESDRWLGVLFSKVADLNGDGIDDLLFLNTSGMTNGKVTKQAALRIYEGRHGARWGSVDRPTRTADWRFWNVPHFDYADERYAVLDHDCDGANDIVFYADNNAVGYAARVTVMYGRAAGGLPDTSAIESVDLTTTGGRSTLFSDVTGDHSRELLVNCGLDNIVRVFAGRPGQRLVAQYGSGRDKPIAGMGWWDRPWAEIWLPTRLDDSWTVSGLNPFVEIGDVSGDGRDEIWVRSVPYLVGYQGGVAMDSLIDAWIAYPGTGAGVTARLGDIDGSGRQAIAIHYRIYPYDPRDPFPGGVLFVHGTNNVPHNSYPLIRKSPHIDGEGCQGPLGVVDMIDTRNAFENEPAFSVSAFITDKQLKIQWSTTLDAAATTVMFSNVLGEHLRAYSVAPGESSLTIDDGLACSQPVLISVRNAHRVATTVCRVW